MRHARRLGIACRASRDQKVPLAVILSGAKNLSSIHLEANKKQREILRSAQNDNVFLVFFGGLYLPDVIFEGDDEVGLVSPFWI